MKGMDAVGIQIKAQQVQQGYSIWFLCLFLVPFILGAATPGAATPGEDEGATEPPREITDDGIVKGPVWSQELLGLRTDLEEVVHHWIERQGPHGRFLPPGADPSDSTMLDSIFVAAAPEDWAAAFEVVENWPAYLSVTGDQKAFAAFMGLCFAFADEVLGLAPEDSTLTIPSKVLIPASYKNATAAIISYSYALVPHSPAETWLRAIEERWSFPRHDPLQIRLELALLRQTRDPKRADRIRLAAEDFITRPVTDRLDEDLETADLMIDLAAVMQSQAIPGKGPGRTDLLEKVYELITKSMDLMSDDSGEDMAARSGLLAEIALRYRSLSHDQRIDPILVDWIYSGEHDLHLYNDPLPAGLMWKINGGDDPLATALKTARIELDRHHERLRGVSAGIWDGDRVKCRDSFTLLALVTQAGLVSRNGRVPDLVIRYRDAHGVLGLRNPVSVHCEIAARNEIIVSFWHSYFDPVTVWVEPVPDGAKLGRSWWEVKKRNADGYDDRSWSALPYLKIGRVGPLVLGRQKILRLRMKWVPGESLIRQWCEPPKSPMILGPGGPALR